jgi:hypothetical protein
MKRDASSSGRPKTRASGLHTNPCRSFLIATTPFLLIVEVEWKKIQIPGQGYVVFRDALEM